LAGTKENRSEGSGERVWVMKAMLKLATKHHYCLVIREVVGLLTDQDVVGVWLV